MNRYWGAPSYRKDHPYIMSSKGLGGGFEKIAIFADVQYCIYADIISGWVKRKSKNMLTQYRDGALVKTSLKYWIW